jgi:hypothetical protein
MTLDFKKSVDFLPDSFGQSRADSVNCGQVISIGMVDTSASAKMP